MSTLKDQDPDYGPSVATNEKHQRIYEENARNSTARKITAIVEKEFSQEIRNKEQEILEIQERLHKTLKTLHLLRYVVVADFYGRKQCQIVPVGESRQTQIHPAIKELIGKSPGVHEAPSTSADENLRTDDNLRTEENREAVSEAARARFQERDEEKAPREKRKLEEEPRPRKIPRYIPPKSGLPESPDPSRSARHKVRKRIIVGNISKWIPPDWREDAASHKWTTYVRGDKENPDIDDFVAKVRFFLHPSYRPNDVVEVASAPFCLSRRGWGEFPVRVQLHFKSALDKPMDIIHHLKLDRTYTGLQTLGSETLVDIWIVSESRQSRRNAKEEQNAAELEARTTIESVKSEPVVKSEPDSDSALNSPEPESSSSVFEEPVTERDRVLVIQRLRFCVRFDHDYTGTECTDDSKENNLTIRHSSPQPEDARSELCENQRDANCSFVPSIDLKEQFPPTEKADFVTSDGSLFMKQSKYRANDCAERIVLGPSTKVEEPTLRPLRISIPPPFENAGSKRVLVVQNDRTIPVDISSGKPRNALNGSRVKLSLQGRGLSLLKKRNPENGKETAVNPTSLKLKPTSTLLLNVNSNVPTLKIVETPINPVTNAEKTVKSEEQAELPGKSKVTLGKDKHKVQSRRHVYERTLRSIETARIPDTRGLLRFIIRRLPIAAPEAVDPDYRRLHPYACRSREEFLEQNPAKRRALEWSRASIARRFLVRRGIPEDELWSVKEIMVWTQLHGYTPRSLRLTESSGCSSSSSSSDLSTVSEPLAFQKWLRSYPTTSRTCSVDRHRQPAEELEIIDVESEQSLPVKSEAAKIDERTKNACKVDVLELEKSSLPLYEFVAERAREIGAKLASEEIVPNVLHCSAGRVMMSALESLVEELLRGALANAGETGAGEVVRLEDVRRAILNREEFDFLTNAGLGSNCQPSLMD